jgi:hypothetical protein
MKFTYALIVGLLATVVPTWAVYAPVPEQEQGKNLTAAIKAGVSYDSNIFGSATDAISSRVWSLAPTITYNASLTDQTFFSAIYGLTLDEFERRPGTKLLDSHDLTLRLAHAFTQSSVLDLTDTAMLTRNPSSLLNGVALNTDQSFTRNQFDGHYSRPLSPKFGGEVKVRSAYTKYRTATLGRLLDRTENLYGLAGNYAILPEAKAVAEYRHQDVYYRKLGELKNKSSDYVMGGFDYEAGKKLTLSTRLGAEWRRRSSEPSATAPFAEASAKYDYSERSFVTAGYGYSFDEASDPSRFTDQKVNRLFVNVEHAVTALIVASASVDYEPAVLQGRLGQPNINETTTRTGVALSYLPTKNWSVTASYDYDNTRSDDPARSVVRHRVGVSGSYRF